MAAAAAPLFAGCKPAAKGDKWGIEPDPSVNSSFIVPKANALPITGTFLDEISFDIPHQNWGEREWDRDFRYMKDMGIDTVIEIRCGLKKFITYPSPYLLSKGCYMPSVDLVDMFCRLAEKYGMLFFETSAKTGENVEEIFFQSANEIAKKIEEGYYDLENDTCGIKQGFNKRSQQLNLNDGDAKKSGGCCN